MTGEAERPPSAVQRWLRPLSTLGRGEGSLRLRLIVAAIISSGLAVAFAGTAMVVLVNHHIERRVIREIRSHLDQLIALDGEDPDVRADLADPRFDRPFSGLYWQVSEHGEPKIRSRSLWDQTLPLTGVAMDGADDTAFQVTGPRQQTLIAVSRQVTFGKAAEGRERLFQLIVAVDRAEIDQLIEDFALEAAAFLGALVLILAIAGWLQVSIGLRPLDGLREMLLAIRRGRAERLTGPFPDEVIPLVEELNALIDGQSRSLERARARAGDLAHGLKTPLAIISSETRILRDHGEIAAAETIEAEVIGMSRFVERHLARARIAAHQRFGQSIDLGKLMQRLVRTMRRLPGGDELDWQVEFALPAHLALHPEDADEIFGNLLDNARKFAAAVVRISLEERGEQLRILIADDGPGVPEPMREIVLLRGHRLDESVQGSGLGLSIVDDLVASYGGRLTLGDRDGGGLEVEVLLPRGDAPPATSQPG